MTKTFQLESDPMTTTYGANLDLLKQDNERLKQKSKSNVNIAVTKDVKEHFAKREHLAKEAEQLLLLKSEDNRKLKLSPDNGLWKEKAFPALNDNNDAKTSIDSNDNTRRHDKHKIKPNLNKKKTSDTTEAIIEKPDKYIQKQNAWEIRAIEIANRLEYKTETIFKNNKKNDTMAKVAAATFLAFEKRVRAVKAIDNLRKHKHDHGALRDFATDAYVDSFMAIREVFKLNKNASNISMPSMNEHKKMRFQQALAKEKINLKMLSTEKPGGFCREQATKHACIQMTHLYEINGMDGAPCSWCVLPRGSGGPKGICEYVKEANKLVPLGWFCKPLKVSTKVGTSGEEIEPIEEMKEETTLPMRHSQQPRNEEGAALGASNFPGVDDELAKQFTDDMAQEVVSDAVRKVHLNTILQLRENINVTAVKRGSLIITEKVVSNVVPRVTQAIAAVLSESVTRTAVNGISSYLIPSLTHSITATISQSLTRSPRTDFYCWYCKKEKIYCHYCYAGTAAATATDYYGSYYAEYYSRYYAYYYSSVLGDGFVDDVLGL
jgi:hypothetical protein